MDLGERHSPVLRIEYFADRVDPSEVTPTNFGHVDTRCLTFLITVPRGSDFMNRIKKEPVQHYMQINPHHPSAEQGFLLRASILHGDAAIRAWNKWQDLVDFEEIDYGSIQLLALLYKNLKLHQIIHPSIDIFRGIYRRIWYQNHVLLAKMIPVLKALHELKFDAMLLEGAALTLTQYKDNGLRPIHDFVVVVPPEQGERTVSAMVEIGWSQKPVSAGLTGAIFRAERASDGLQKEAVPVFELRASLFPQSDKGNTDEVFWKDAVMTYISGVPTRTLNTTDQLLHACIQTTRWHHLMPLSGFGDAMFVLENSRDVIDWNRFHALSERLGFTPLLEGVLDYLKNELHAPVSSRT